MRTNISILVGFIGVAVAGGFSGSCYDCHMFNGHNADMNGHLLKCICGDGRGEWDWTEIGLDAFIGNVNGNLAWYR